MSGMRIIALETATMAGGIAVVDEERVISEISLNIKATYSEKLMVAMEHLLDLSGLTINEMDAIAVSVGPGSFTGLRIGLSAAKGLSYASGKPIIGVPTLDALALNIPFSNRLVCPVLDARKGEVYTALYRPNGQFPQKLTDDMVVSPLKLIEMIKEETVFLGDGVFTYRTLFNEQLKGLYHEVPMPLMAPRASNVGMLAMERLKKGEVDDPYSLVPRYIRKSEAEVKFKV